MRRILPALILRLRRGQEAAVEEGYSDQVADEFSRMIWWSDREINTVTRVL